MMELDIKAFFTLAVTQIELVKQIKKSYGKELAQDFNSFDFWLLDENKVSEIIASLLNPKGSHEQGDVFLRHFVNKFNLNFFWNENDEITIQCEFTTDGGRRIDIIVYKNNFDQVFAIENKIYVGTPDQRNQVQDYIDFLTKRTKGNFCLIYLSPRDKLVSADSLTYENKLYYIKEGNLKLLTYEEQMIDCLSEFGNLSKNPRVKSFINDFEKKLRKMYMREENRSPEQTAIDLITANENNLKISILVSKSLQKFKEQLKQKFEQDIKEIGHELGLEVEGIRLRPNKWTKNRISFNYEMQGLIYGITRLDRDDDKTRFPEIETRIGSEINETFQASPWWPMWQFFYRDIDSNSQFWLEVKNDRAKARARQFIKLVNDNFNDERF